MKKCETHFTGQRQVTQQYFMLKCMCHIYNIYVVMLFVYVK